MSKIKLGCFVGEDRDYIGFYKLIKEWERLGLAEIGERPPYPARRYMRHIFSVWVGRVGGLVLDPTTTRVTATNDPFEHALITEYTDRVRDIPNTHPWNFWVRDLDAYNVVRNEMVNVKKKVESIFSGTIRGAVHERNKWKNSTEIFSFSGATHYKKTNRLRNSIIDYYRLVSSSKFGLCPVGDQGFCQREVETIGLGAIPVFTPGTLNRYHEPMVEDEHFIYAENPEEMHQKINGISEEKRTWMVERGQDYYKRRLSPEGMWSSVLETIDKYNIKVD